ncbi:hypothetical protein [Defluviitalea saccharophila]|uniref:Uncharacterized protein n=1 Tax=Defluviitalea saccharophila TaxID=879970 RepID=A0ABZ2Y2F6_9FIRM|nr:hypothetical protein [Candidatus Epulonipiscium sp.]
MMSNDLHNPNIFHNKVDFEHETSTASMHFQSGDRPTGREAKSQKAQLNSKHSTPGRGDVRIQMNEKQT